MAAVVTQSLASHFPAKKNRSQQQREAAQEQPDIGVVKADGSSSSSSSAFQFAFDVQDTDSQQPSGGKKKKKSKKKLKKKSDVTAQMDAPVDMGGYIAVEDAGDLLAQLLMGTPQKLNVKGQSPVAPSAKQAPEAPKQESTMTTESDNITIDLTANKSKNSAKKKKKKAAKKQQQQVSSFSMTAAAATATPSSSSATTSKSSTKASSKQQEPEPAVSPSFLKLRKATGSESEIAKMQLRYGRGRRNLAAIAQREERKKKTMEQPASSDADSTASALGPEKNASDDAGATEFKFNFGT